MFDRRNRPPKVDQGRNLDISAARLGQALSEAHHAGGIDNVPGRTRRELDKPNQGRARINIVGSYDPDTAGRCYPIPKARQAA